MGLLLLRVATRKGTHMDITFNKIVSFAPSAHNRDDVGMPKTCQVGGTIRARYSSASITRVIREHVRTRLIQKSKGIMSDTCLLPMAVLKRLREDRQNIDPKLLGRLLVLLLPANCLDKEWFLDPAVLKCRYAGRYTSEDINGISSFIAKNLDEMQGSDEFKELLAIEAKLVEEHKNKGKAKKKDGQKKNDEPKTTKNRFSKALKESLSGLPIPTDLSLFGRFLADKEMPIETVVSSVQVSDAFSTHESLPERDFFSRGDDFSKEFKQQGSSIIGTKYFNAPTMFFEANVNLDGMIANMIAQDPKVNKEDVKAAALEGISLFMEAWAFSMTKVGQTSSSDYPLPSFLGVTVAECPITYKPAFVQPVYYANESYRNDAISESVNRLLQSKDVNGFLFSLNKVTKFDRWISTTETKEPKPERAKSFDDLNKEFVASMGKIIDQVVEQTVANLPR